MQNSFRAKARFVAIVDLMLTSLSLWIPIVLFIFVTQLISALVHVVVSLDEDEAEKAVPAGLIPITLFLLFFIIAVSVVGIQFLAAVKLYIATAPGQDPITSVKHAKFWKYSNMVFNALHILHFVFGGIGGGGVVATLISMALRLYAFYIVQNFIWEAQTHQQAQPVLWVPFTRHDGDINPTAVSQHAQRQGNGSEV